MDWMVQDLNPGGGRDILDSSRLDWRPIQPHIKGDWVSFLEVMWSGHGVGHPSPSSAEVVYRQRYTSPQGLLGILQKSLYILIPTLLLSMHNSDLTLSVPF